MTAATLWALAGGFALGVILTLALLWTWAFLDEAGEVADFIKDTGEGTAISWWDRTK